MGAGGAAAPVPLLLPLVPPLTPVAPIICRSTLRRASKCSTSASIDASSTRAAATCAAASITSAPLNAGIGCVSGGGSMLTVFAAAFAAFTGAPQPRRMHAPFLQMSLPTSFPTFGTQTVSTPSKSLSLLFSEPAIFAALQFQSWSLLLLASHARCSLSGHDGARTSEATRCHGARAGRWRCWEMLGKMSGMLVMLQRDVFAPRPFPSRH